jgi:hypothetical protein
MTKTKFNGKIKGQPVEVIVVTKDYKQHKKDFVLVTDFMMHLKMGKKFT